MDAFKLVKGCVAPVAIKNVDTDQIIPAKYLTSISRAGYGEHLFRNLRDSDSSFFMNKDKYKGASILVVDENFGCGSSREHAVWALMGAGIRVIIGKSFADIFANNAAKNGLLLITLRSFVVEVLITKAVKENVVVSVDLERQIVQFADGTQERFEYDAFRKHCLLRGLDDIDYILSYKTAIEDYRDRREYRRRSH